MEQQPPKVCPDCQHDGGFKRRGDHFMCKWCGRIWWPIRLFA